jgi:xanthine dehydrogenase YagS FAD-binding subunit
MKSFENIDVKSVKEAVNLLQKFQQQKKTVAVVGGGSEYLQLMKDHVVEPDYLINLKTIPGLDYIKEERSAFRIGALAKLADIETHPEIQEKLLILSSAAGEAASPQIRDAGTIAGNLCQRPFCWYFRSANFTCLRKGGQVCYTVTGDSRSTRSSVQGRAILSIPRIPRRRWWRSARKSRLPGLQGKRRYRWKNSSFCPL